MESVEVQQDTLTDEPLDSVGPSDPKQGIKVKAITEDGKDKSAVRITVHPPELREGKFGGIGSYHAYKVTMVPNEIEHVFRRYKDFEWLRSSLTAWFPCLFIPPLPPKRVFGSQGDKFVADRRSDLERFLVRCAGIRHLAASPPFKMFMCRAATFDDGIKEIATKNTERTAGVIIKDYRETFPHVQEGKLPEDSEQRISALKEFLENSEKKLLVLADDTQNLANAMNTVTSQLSKITISLEQMYTEEKGFPHKVDPQRVDVLENINQWHLGIKQTAPLYETLFAKNFQNELQDIESFIELFKMRDYIMEQQKKQVKKVAQLKAESARKPSSPQASLEADQLKEKEFAEVVDIMTQLILGSEFQRFWKDRTGAFKAAMNAFASEQLGVAKQAVGFWESLSSV
jgi:sorting nexin-1/2